MTELYEIYKQTDYKVMLRQGVYFSFQADHQSQELQDLMVAHSVNCGCYLTAWNPLSQKIGRAENILRNDRLATDLLHQPDVLVLTGYAQREGWMEESFLALGLSHCAGLVLARRHQQNAFLAFDDLAIPTLVYPEASHA